MIILNENLLTIKDYCLLVGVSKQRIHDLIRNKDPRIKFVEWGRMKLIDKSSTFVSSKQYSKKELDSLKKTNPDLVEEILTRQKPERKRLGDVVEFVRGRNIIR